MNKASLSLLEQAIVDASELKASAIRNAEQGVVEKYKDQIKQAVESLLEGDDFDGTETDDGEASEPAAETVPLAATTGEKACSCPEEDQEIEISFEDLEKLSQEMPGDSTEVETHADLATSMDGTDTEEPELPSESKKETGTGETLQETEEVIEISAEELKKLKEELMVALEPMRQGWLGTNKTEEQYLKDIELAREAADKTELEVKDLKDTVDSLKTENKTLKEKLVQAKTILESMAISNARLLYTNKILNSSSLNERQKASLVEAVGKAKTVDQTKLVFESLSESIVGGTLHAPQDSTLTEVLKNKQGSFLNINEPKQTDSTDVAKQRMQMLAGIKK